jgi:hypothetical protein
MSGRAAGSGSWLHALPIFTLGLRLSDDETRIAVGLRLGAPNVRQHTVSVGLILKCNSCVAKSIKPTVNRDNRRPIWEGERRGVV